MTDVVPFLMFQQADAAEAMSLYVSLFPDGTVLSDQRYGSDGPGPEGTIVMAEFTIAGQRVRCSDSYVRHAFEFTPSTSLFVNCDSAEELRRLYDSLLQGGGALMPLDDYGFGPFGWVNDRFGVSWQLQLQLSAAEAS